MKKEKQYQLITVGNLNHISMRLNAGEKAEDVNVILATFDEKLSPTEAKEMAQATCDMLNSQAYCIQDLINENFELKKKCIELARKIKPFGGPDGSG